MRYETVLLDLDHTLFDSDRSEIAAFQRALETAGVPDCLHLLPRYQRINLDLWAAVERGEIEPAAVRTGRFERFIEAADIDADAARMADEFVAGLAASGDLYRGARELVERLSACVRLGLITNGFSEVQRARLERLGIAGHFDTITISAEVGAAKPAQRIFEAAFDGLGAPDKETALMVGDSLASDIRGGAAYGIATCWFNPDAKRNDGAQRPTHEIAALSELPDLIAGTFRS